MKNWPDAIHWIQSPRYQISLLKSCQISSIKKDHRQRVWSSVNLTIDYKFKLVSESEAVALSADIVLYEELH